MRVLTAIFIALFALLQYQLWFGNFGVAQTLKVKGQIKQQLLVNNQLQQRNDKLSDQVQKLKTNHKAIESLARHDLGMIKSNETYYQFVK